MKAEPFSGTAGSDGVTLESRPCPIASIKYINR